MIVTNRSRRQFLVGAGGFTLALPFLPSLYTGSAKAQAAVAPRRFIAFATHHGGAWGENMYPAASTLTESKNLAAGHTAKRGNLQAQVSGSTASISRVLSGPSSLLNERIVSKMNVLRGVDVSFYLGHHTGGHLGNYARADREFGEGDFVSKLGGQVPTIDQVMAWSKSFYSDADLGSIRERSMNIGGGGKYISYGRTGSGRIEPVPTTGSARALFDNIFVASQPAAQTPASNRKPVVDRVRESYQRMVAGAFGDATRLSKQDKNRLQDHIARLDELERRVNAVASRSCGDVTKPSKDVSEQGGYENGNDVNATKEYFRIFNDVIVAAFICGTSRIATVYSNQLWSSYSGDWHQEVAHLADQEDGTKQNMIVQAYQAFFENVFLDLVNKLDIEEVDGRTYLDNTLVQWTHESGPSTHDPISIPVITAGSAGGWLKTGNYCDYRNDGAPSLGFTERKPWRDLKVGILYNQWLATALQAMGVPPSEYMQYTGGRPGYGSGFHEDYYGKGKDLWPDRLTQTANDPVPFLKA